MSFKHYESPWELVPATIADYQKKAVGIFSLEMGVDQLTDRFLSLRTGAPGESLKGEPSTSNN